jgi:epoxyqueuosine reductase
MMEAKYLKELVKTEGFDLCGITACRHLTLSEEAFGRWLTKGYDSSLGYMRNYLDRRFDAAKLVEGARTVVVCAASYDGTITSKSPDTSTSYPKIASYACRRDYHKVIRKALLSVLRQLRERYPQLQGRAFVDSAPLVEKQLAVDAGLGWIGRQSLLVTPQYGSYVLLGELVLTEEVDVYDTPMQTVGCGECRRCVEACPTGAIVDDMVINTARCISCHTVEVTPSDAVDLHGWVFGCDECQRCCPYNRAAKGSEHYIMPREFSPQDISAEEWLTMSEKDFLQRFGHTPLKRAGLKKIQSNILR